MTLRKHAPAIYRDFLSCDKFYIFLIFAQNINCGYMLEPPSRGEAVLTSIRILCFGEKIRKIGIPL